MNRLLTPDSVHPAAQGGRERLLGLDPREALDPNALVIVLIGASAVGKSAVAEYLCEAGIVEATPTWTTRQPRQGELDTSYDHRFVTDETFDLQAENGGFMDQRAFYGARYAVPFLEKPSGDREALMVLKPVFIPVFVEHFPRARIYQIEASPKILPGRMKARGQSQEDIDERMRQHGTEAATARSVAHVIFNNNGSLEQTLQRVAVQIHADRESFAVI